MIMSGSPIFHRLAVFDEDLRHRAGAWRGNLVERLHRLDDQQLVAGLHLRCRLRRRPSRPVADGDRRFRPSAISPHPRDSPPRRAARRTPSRILAQRPERRAAERPREGPGNVGAAQPPSSGARRECVAAALDFEFGQIAVGKQASDETQQVMIRGCAIRRAAPLLGGAVSAAAAPG